MPIDYTTTAGRVRLLIPDKDETDPIFIDGEIDAFLAMSQDSVAYATALALETIASDTVMLLKARRIADLQFDGARDAETLYARANVLRENAEVIDATAEEIVPGVLETTNVVDEFTWRRWLGRDISGA